MTVSFEIASEHRDDAPPFSDGCEGCMKRGIDFRGIVIPFATVTYGDALVAFYHHGRCGSEWYTSWAARYSHTWQRVIAPDTGGRRLSTVPALPAPRSEAR